MAKPSKSKRPARSVIVTVADDALASIHELAAELAAKGMKVERVLPVTGVISGSYAADLAGLGRVKGVESVEEELRAHLPPAGDKLQ